MHPTAALLLWLFGVLATQVLNYTGLGLLFLFVVASSPASFLSIVQFARRGRWLFLSLWLILAYGKPGELVADYAWAPTWEGVYEANLQAVRLLAMLACLAWLLTRLGRNGMVSALWGCLRPLATLGLDVERLVVRLSLVLEHLKTPLPSGAWKTMLLKESRPESVLQQISIALPTWTFSDRILVFSLPFCFLWIVL